MNMNSIGLIINVVFVATIVHENRAQDFCRMDENNDLVFIFDQTTPPGTPITCTYGYPVPPMTGAAPYVIHTCTYDGKRVIRNVTITAPTTQLLIGKVTEFEFCSNLAATTGAPTNFDENVCVIDDKCIKKANLLTLANIPPTTDNCLKIATDAIVPPGGTQMAGVLKAAQAIRDDKTSKYTCDFAKLAGGGGGGAADCRIGKHNRVFYQKSDEATHCIVPDTYRNAGKCVSIADIHSVYSREFKKRDNKRRTNDRSWEHKRYLLEHRTQIYHNGNDYDDNDGGKHNDNSKNGFKTLFQDAGELFTNSHGGTHITTVGGITYGADVFCEMAFLQFPVSNEAMFSKLGRSRIIDCPTAGLPTCVKTNAFRSTRRDVNLVWFASAGAKPTKCFIPNDQYRISDAGKCITFAKAQELLNDKSTDDGDGDNGNHKRDTIGGLLRAYHGRGPNELNVDDYRWGKLRREKSVKKILEDVDDALGYKDDETVEFDVQGGKIKVSPHSFCTLVVDLVPFKPRVLNDELEDC